MPAGTDDRDLEILDGLVQPLGPLHKGDHVFRQGDGFRAIYAVRAGYLKTYVGSDSGEERIIGFHLSGDLFGLASLSAGYMLCSAQALDTAVVCRLPFEDLIAACREIPDLERQLFRLMSRHLQTVYALSVNQSVEGRMAYFLLQWGERMSRLGCSSSRFVLPMARYEIASYLGLTPETVSRCLGRFSERAWIGISHREVILTDEAALRNFVSANGPD